MSEHYPFQTIAQQYEAAEQVLTPQYDGRKQIDVAGLILPEPQVPVPPETAIEMREFLETWIQQIRTSHESFLGFRELTWRHGRAKVADLASKRDRLEVAPTLINGARDMLTLQAVASEPHPDARTHNRIWPVTLHKTELNLPDLTPDAVQRLADRCMQPKTWNSVVTRNYNDFQLMDAMLAATNAAWNLQS